MSYVLLAVAATLKVFYADGIDQLIEIGGGHRIAVLRDGQAFNVTQRDARGQALTLQHPAAALTPQWSDAERAAIGVVALTIEAGGYDPAIHGAAEAARYSVVDDHQVTAHVSGAERGASAYAAELAALVSARCHQVDDAEIAARAQGVAFGQHMAQIRLTDDQGNAAGDLVFITGASLGALIAKTSSAAFTVNFRMADNSDVALDADAMIGLGQAALARVSAIHGAASAIKDRIRAAGDIGERVLDAAAYLELRASIEAIATTIAV